MNKKVILYLLIGILVIGAGIYSTFYMSSRGGQGFIQYDLTTTDTDQSTVAIEPPVLNVDKIWTYREEDAGDNVLIGQYEFAAQNETIKITKLGLHFSSHYPRDLDDEDKFPGSWVVRDVIYDIYFVDDATGDVLTKGRATTDKFNEQYIKVDPALKLEPGQSITLNVMGNIDQNFDGGYISMNIEDISASSASGSQVTINADTSILSVATIPDNKIAVKLTSAETLNIPYVDMDVVAIEFTIDHKGNDVLVLEDMGISTIANSFSIDNHYLVNETNDITYQSDASYFDTYYKFNAPLKFNDTTEFTYHLLMSDNMYPGQNLQIFWEGPNVFELDNGSLVTKNSISKTIDINFE